ncbi:hypothetical protein GC207_08080 [bacterium]|nr:hypothetical protein [bacterium]
MIRYGKKMTWLALLGSLLLGGSARAYEGMYEQAPINYSKSQPDGPVAKLQRKLDSGEVHLDRENEKEFLRELMAQFQIPVESQVLVFSKTSHQNALISPHTPRAVYYGDNVYMGWVQGGVVEVADMSPKLGMTYYVLDHRDKTQPLQFVRTSSCLDCHAGSRVNNMPGMMVRSVYPASDGQPILSQGSYVTDQGSTLSERWGGWYVTGLHGEAHHMGNSIAKETPSGIEFDMSAGANCRDLSQYFDTNPYLRTTSDIVALMVLEHQTEMQNVLSQGGMFVRLAAYRQEMLRKELGEPATDEYVGSTLTVARSQTEKIVQHLLFCDEIMLPDAGIQGSPDFQTAFQRNARRDDEGRSLKDFQLKHRLFRYPCSYMIYSAAFDDLPPRLKEMVYDRLLQVLDGRVKSREFAHLGSFERDAIKSILLATKSDLPANWREN